MIVEKGETSMSDFEFAVIVLSLIVGIYLFLRHVCGLSKGGTIFAMVAGLIGSLWVFGQKDSEKKRD